MYQTPRKLKPNENLWIIKVDQPGPILYVHPLGDDGYQVMDKREGCAAWKDEPSAILFIMQLQRLTPHRFKLEIIEGK